MDSSEHWTQRPLGGWVVTPRTFVISISRTETSHRGHALLPTFLWDLGAAKLAAQARRRLHTRVSDPGEIRRYWLHLFRDGFGIRWPIFPGTPGFSAEIVAFQGPGRGLSREVWGWCQPATPVQGQLALRPSTPYFSQWTEWLNAGYTSGDGSRVSRPCSASATSVSSESSPQTGTGLGAGAVSSTRCGRWSRPSAAGTQGQ